MTANIKLDLTRISTAQVYAADLAAVAASMSATNGSNPLGYSIFGYSGNVASDISIRAGLGFGVGGSNSVAGVEIGKGEKLHVVLDSPASSLTFQLAWLNSVDETAVYKLTYSDGTTAMFSILTGSDGVDAPVTAIAPQGKTITAIDFTTPTSGALVNSSDYLVNNLSYLAANLAYKLNVIAKPASTNSSEQVVELLLTTQEGVMVSDAKLIETLNGVSTWALLVENGVTYNGATVSVDKATGVVTVTGLMVTAPAGASDVTVTATAITQSGQVSTSIVSTDTTAPIAPVVTLAKDTGLSASDGITSSGLVNVGNVESGASWEYSVDGGHNWISGTGSSFTLPEGKYSAGVVQVRQTDVAGNVSAATLMTAVTIDTTVLAPVVTLAQDTGLSASDGITSSGLVNVGNVESGASWEYSIDGGQNWISGTGSSFTLPEGAYSAGAVLVRQADVAGNVSDVVELAALTVDKTVSAPMPILGIDSQGILTGLISVANLESGDTWEYSINGGVSWVSGTGSSFTLAEGVYAANDVQVRQTDVAGNVSDAAGVAAMTIRHLFSIMDDYNLLSGLDFQSQNINSWTDLDLGTISTLWKTNNINNIIEIGKETIYGGTSKTNQLIELAANDGDASNLYTYVIGEKGTTVYFDFDLSARSDVDSRVNVLVNGKVVDTIDPGSNFGWQHHSYRIVATGEAQRIELQAVSHNSVGAVVDNLALGSEKINQTLGCVDFSGEFVPSPNGGLIIPSQTHQAWLAASPVLNFQAQTLSSWASISAETVNNFWHTDNTGGLIEVGKETVYGGKSQANNVVELAANNGDASNLYTYLISAKNSILQFDFDLSARVNVDSKVNVLVNGTVIDTIDPGRSFGWQHHSYDIVATGEVQRFELQAVNHNSVGALVDNLTITSNSNAVMMA